MIRGYKVKTNIKFLLQWVKDLALPQLWHRSQLQLRFNPWPRNFHMQWKQKKKKKKKKKEKLDHQGGHTELAVEDVLRFPDRPKPIVEELKQGWGGPGRTPGYIQSP